ncbi:MAG: hypothetical protein WCK09_16870, partial [Bacteroidota bacterium]
SGNETAPAGGYSITAIPTGASATNNIIIQGSSSTVTAYTPQASGTLNDAIFKIIGADFITIQNFTMQENAANTTTTVASNNMTEWGVALLYVSTTNGAQNNTIQNNTISLNRSYSNTFGIYSNVRHSATAPTTTADITLATGSNLGTKIYSNSISNVDYGIVFVGSSAAVAMDNGNDVGGSSIATANTITNWGGLVSGAISSYVSVTGSNACIFMNHQINDNVSFNTITSATNITTLTTSQILGVLKNYSTGQPTGLTFTSNYNSNTVTLTNAPTTSQMSGISMQGLTTLSTATFNCNNNNILNCANTGASATSSSMLGIFVSSAPGTFNINGNTIRGFTSTATSGGFVGVQQQTNGVVTALNINNNKIGDATAGAVTFSNATSGAVSGIVVTSSGAASTCALVITGNDFRGIVHSIAGSSAHSYISNASATLSQNISSNTFTNLNVNTTGSVTFISNGVLVSATGTQTINNNSIVTAFNKSGAGGTVTLATASSSSAAGATINHTNNNFSNITVTGATTIAGWLSTDGGAANKNYTGNTFSNWTGGSSSITAMSINYGGGNAGNGNYIYNNTISSLTGTGTITGITFGTTSGTLFTVTGNTITGLSSTGTGGIVSGIIAGGTTDNVYANTINTLSSTSTTATVAGITSSATTANIYSNTINSLSCVGTTSGVANGIMVTAGTTVSVFKNKIYDLTTSGAFTTTPGVNGIVMSAGTTVNIYNNLIGDLKAPAASSTDAIRGISITSSTSSTTYNVYYNTVYLTGAGGTNFGTSGIFHAASTTATTAKLDLRNNIIVNNCTPSGTGLVVAYRRSNGIANMLNNYASTSNNNLFYTTPSATGYYFYHDGTSNAQTMAAYVAGAFTAGTIAPRDAVSVTQNPTFISTTGSSANFLHINAAISTPIESGGQKITTPAITDDFDANTRWGETGYSGSGTSTDIGADEFNGIPSYTCSTPVPGNTVSTANNLCLGQSITLSLQNAITGTGNSYQWQSSADGSAYNNVSGAIASSYAVTPAAPLYYQCVVTCQNGPSTATSTPVQITFTNSINGTTPGSRCGTGTVSLAASTGGTGTLKWYGAAAGGTPIGATGSPWTTPSISSTTTYYVGAETSTSGNSAVGAGASTSSTYSNPFYSAWSNIHTQHLITAAELAAAGLTAGNITSVALDVTSAGTLPMINLSVKIGTTAATNLATFAPNGGFTTVYTNASLMPTTGLNVLTFSPAFYWDGTSNIVLEFCHGNGASSATMSRTIKTDVTSYVSSIKTHVSSATAAATVCADVTSNLLTYSERPTFTFAGQVACSSPRSAVVATITASPVLTISGNQTICNNSPATITVSSTLSDFDSYIWTPITNLFTDAGCTTPYTAGASATTVYAKSVTAGSTTYTCSASNSVSLCANTAASTVTILPATPAVTASPVSLCLGGISVLTTSPATGYGTATFQWQNSPDGSTYSNISGATSLTYTTPTITSTTYYKLQVSSVAGLCSESTATVTVNNPQVTGTTPGSRCGTGTVTLGASGSSGTTLNWYSAASGGSSLGSGSSFNTPSISSTTTYYVSSSTAGGIFNGARLAPASTANTTPSSYGLVFDVTTAFTLNSVDVYNASSSGSMVIQLQTNTGSVLFTSGTFTVPTGTGVTPYTAALGWPVSVGTGYRLLVTSGTASLVRESSLGGFPYALGTAGSVTSGYISGTSTTYYFLYNWNISTGCESSRTAVPATVNPAPSITATATPATICNGGSSTLDASSSNSGYTYSWSPYTFPTTGASVSASPGATTLYTVTGTDNSGGANAGCATNATVTITVNPPPAVVTITPAAAGINAGDIQQLVASGGSSSATILSENFNGSATGWTVTNGGSSPAVCNWYYQTAPYTDALGSATFLNFSTLDGGKFALSNSDAGGSGSSSDSKLASPVFSTVGYSSATITFEHAYQSWSSDITVALEISTDGGATWPTILKNYKGTSVGNTTNNAQTTANDNISLASYLNQSNLKIRFNYVTPWGYYWIVDNVQITGTLTGSMTWSPTTDLYTDAAATTAYSGGAATTVYSKPAATTTYTATATSGNGCTSSKDVTVTVLQPDVTWTGNISTNWGDPLNWNPNNVPGLSNNATIPAVTNLPIVNEAPGTPAGTYNLTIQSLASVTVAAGKALTVNGTLTNSAGTTGLVVKSNGVDGTGSLILNTANVNGTFERWMTDANWTDWIDGWHFLSSPVDVQAISPNFTTDPYDFYCWAEPSNLWVNYKNTTIAPTWNTANGSTNFTVGRGYLVAYDAAGLTSFSGKLNVADVSKPSLTYTPASYSGDVTAGFNLLGNPFSCALKWSTGWSKTNIAANAKIWNELGAAYVDIAANGIIPATQGFMVEV